MGLSCPEQIFFLNPARSRFQRKVTDIAARTNDSNDRQSNRSL